MIQNLWECNDHFKRRRIILIIVPSPNGIRRTRRTIVPFNFCLRATQLTKLFHGKHQFRSKHVTKCAMTRRVWNKLDRVSGKSPRLLRPLNTVRTISWLDTCLRERARVSIERRPRQTPANENPSCAKREQERLWERRFSTSSKFAWWSEENLYDSTCRFAE